MSWILRAIKSVDFNKLKEHYGNWESQLSVFLETLLVRLYVNGDNDLGETLFFILFTSTSVDSCMLAHYIYYIVIIAKLHNSL